MGIFDRWFGGKKLETPEALREALFEALVAGDERALSALCEKHAAKIIECFPQWQKVPAEVRADASKIPAYAQGLMGLAQHMAEAGHPELMQRLMPPAAANPITGYESALQRARTAIDELRYDSALEVLEPLVRELGKVQGSAVERYLPIARGFIAECQFHSGRVEAAIEPASLALADCERSGDIEGVVAYRRTLHEIHRYLGQPKPAAHYGALLAESLQELGEVEQARQYRAQVDVLRAGEPLNRVIAAIDGRHYELDAVPPAHNGKLQFLFERNRITLRPAVVAIEEAMQLGSDGKYAESLEALARATELDPFDPQPSYLAGLSLLHLKRYAAAVESYDRCETLAPGWFHVRTDRWLAERLAGSQIDHDTFLAHLELTDGTAPPEQQLALATQMLKAHPSLGIFQLHRGKLLLALGREPEALEAFRAGLALENDAGTRTRLLVELGGRLPDPERAQHLEAAIALDGARVVAAMAQVLLRQRPQLQ